MPVITISREMGSGGNGIAQAVAERLRLRLVDREIINRAARQAGVPEVALAEIDELGLLGVRPRPEAQRLYRETVERLILEMAEDGDLLLLGRGGQVVLAKRPGVLHVRITAPRAWRIERVQAVCHASAEAAAARVEAADRASAGYLRRHYKIRWDDPQWYDLIVNTAQFDFAAAADVICVAATHLARPAEEHR